MEHELWRLVASGLLTTHIDNMVAVTSRDARARLLQAGAFRGKLLVAAYESLSYVPGDSAVYQMEQYIATPVYNPTLDPGAIPFPANAAGGTELSCDDPGVEYEPTVYSWDFTTFTEIGPLSENSTPSAGNYVIVNKRVADGVLGLPSLFLEITS